MNDLNLGIGKLQIVFQNCSRILCREFWIPETRNNSSFSANTFRSMVISWNQKRWGE